VSMTWRAIAISCRRYPEVAVARFRMLPVLADFPVAAVPPSPRPNDSPLYNTIRTRVRKELFPEEGKSLHRQGGDHATACILATAVAAYCIYANMPGRGVIQNKRSPDVESTNRVRTLIRAFTLTMS